MADNLDLKDLKVPTVHLNGNSKSDLMQMNNDVCSLLRQTLEAMARDDASNGRNFYVQEGDALGFALDQKAWRMRQVNRVLEEYEYIGQEIYKQGI